jgi:hypothetical protein
MFKVLITAFALTILLNLNDAMADSTATVAPKSRRAAVVYSLFSTLVPVVVGSQMMDHEKSPELGTGFFSLGLVVGPGVGHAYAANMRRFWSGAATRGAVLSSSVAVAAILIRDSSGKDWEESFGNAMLAIASIGAGVAICMVSAIRDIAAADNSVDAYNKEHGFRSLTLRPTYYATHKAPGLMLTMSF